MYIEFSKANLEILISNPCILSRPFKKKRICFKFLKILWFCFLFYTIL